MKYFLLFFLLAVPWPVHAAPVSLTTPSGTLHGTLELPPDTTLPCPAALIITGSGPTDRDGNSTLLPGANNSLKLLAEALAARGIASIRYDKRGIGESTPAAVSEADLRFETLIDDAYRWINLMKHDRRFSSVTVIGHSEGALLGVVAARKARADAVVAIAGIGRPADQVLLAQVRPQLPPELLRETEAILQHLKQGRTVASIPAPLEPLFRPSVQPYLISWFRYDPVSEIKKFTGPILIAQGTTDIQVGIIDAWRLYDAGTRTRLVLIDGMNHVLKIVPEDPEKQLGSYSDPTLPVAPPLINAIVRFIGSVD